MATCQGRSLWHSLHGQWSGNDLLSQRATASRKLGTSEVKVEPLDQQHDEGHGAFPASRSVVLTTHPVIIRIDHWAGRTDTWTGTNNVCWIYLWQSYRYIMSASTIVPTWSLIVVYVESATMYASTTKKTRLYCYVNRLYVDFTGVVSTEQRKQQAGQAIWRFAKSRSRTCKKAYHCTCSKFNAYCFLGCWEHAALICCLCWLTVTWHQGQGHQNEYQHIRHQ